jgi:hypothetical protein
MKKETQIALAVAVILLVVIAIVAIFMLTGGGGEEQPQPPPAQPPSIAQPPTPPMPSGPTPPTTTMAPSQPSERKPMWRPRKDPFAWLPEEVEAMQADAFGQAPFVLVASPPPPPKVDLPEPYEPQPKRRVAGIILGKPFLPFWNRRASCPKSSIRATVWANFRWQPSPQKEWCCDGRKGIHARCACRMNRPVFQQQVVQGAVVPVVLAERLARRAYPA